MFNLSILIYITWVGIKVLYKPTVIRFYYYCKIHKTFIIISIIQIEELL